MKRGNVFLSKLFSIILILSSINLVSAETLSGSESMNITIKNPSENILQIPNYFSNPIIIFSIIVIILVLLYFYLINRKNKQKIRKNKK